MKTSQVVYCSFSNMPRYHIFGMVKSTVLPLIYFCIIMRIYVFSSMGFKKVIFILNSRRKMLSISINISSHPRNYSVQKKKKNIVALRWFRTEMLATLFLCIIKLPLCPQSQQLNFLLLLLPYLTSGRYVLNSKQFLQKDPRIHCDLLLSSF